MDDVAFSLNTLLNDVVQAYDTAENAIGLLQEYVQKVHRELPDYQETIRMGPDHRPVFTYCVSVAWKLFWEGSGESKQSARQSAARPAMKWIDLEK